MGEKFCHNNTFSDGNVNYRVFDVEHIGKRKYIHILDDNGYKYFVDNSTMIALKNGKVSKFNKVGKNNPYTMDNSKLYVENNSNYKFIGFKIIKGKYYYDIYDEKKFKYRVSKSNFDSYLKGIQKEFSKIGLNQYYSRYNFQNMLDLKSNGSILIDNEWDGGATSKVLVQCSCGNSYKLSWNMMVRTNKYQCNKCSKERKIEDQKIWSKAKLKDMVENNKEFSFLGFETKTYIYENTHCSHILLHFIDRDRYMYRLSLNNFLKYLNGQIESIAKVSKLNPYTFYNINRYLLISKSNYELCEYNGNIHSVKLKCKEHNLYFNGSWSSILRDHKICRICLKESISGENSKNWKGGKNSISKYLRDKIVEWKRNSAKKCNYRCILTGNKIFEIHHLYSFDLILNEVLTEYGTLNKREVCDYTSKELMELESLCLKIHNKYPLGVCISKEIHRLFHSLYGFGGNIPEQFDQFAHRYLKGEFKNAPMDKLIINNMK